MRVQGAIIGSAIAACTAFVQAQYCETVKEPAQKARIDSVTARYVVSSCCRSTLAKCLKTKPACSIAERLANFVCFQAVLGRDYSTIREELAKRDSSLHSSPIAGIDTSLLPLAGDPRSPVMIAVYVSASCPACKRVSVPLYGAVTNGPLSGKASLALVPYSARVGDVAYLAARKFGRFWEYYLSLADKQQRIDEDLLVYTAEWLGIPGGKFKPLLYDKSLESALERSHEKAKGMGISITPAVFINGKRYTSHNDPEWIVDAALYEYERLTAARKKKVKAGK